MPLLRINFELLGIELMVRGTRQISSEKTIQRQFRSWFGLDPTLCVVVWNKLIVSNCFEHASANLNPNHLLWTLHFFKVYNSEENNAGRVGVSEKTFRKWVWIYAKGISNLDKEIVSMSEF